MRWVDALEEVDVVEASGADAEVSGVEYDSRRVEPGAAFVAMLGGTTDGSLYIDGTIAQGAAAIVTDSHEAYARLRRERPEMAAAEVTHGRRALAELSAAVLGHPERKLKISAVTGTNGKTTTAYLLEQMLRGAGRGCVLLGTVETRVVDEVRASPHTTPEASDTLRVFADGVEAGAKEAVMEMSSHALEQERVWGLPVDLAIFTNLTQDHLDYHGTMERYAAAKARLFEGVGARAPRVAVINLDDGAAGKMMEAARGCDQVWTYGVRRGGAGGAGGRVERADFEARSVQLGMAGTSFELHTPFSELEVRSRLVGMVNVYNLVAAMTAGIARGLTVDDVVGLAETANAAPGRFQVVPGSAEAGFTVVVDYAHTDDALRNLIGLARELARERGGRVITVFGCGGDRDRTKRPKMGRAAGEGSDLVVLTSDNPRSEEPMGILAEALKGVRETGVECVVEPERAAAIAIAVRAARAGDIVLIAGKGHERVQIVGDRRVPFDDVEVAAGVLGTLDKYDTK
jgi:UDP-N-acetylmuramoyl-L-alanyl-D-glutamate--2,6-diaminopimelate ligase